MAAPELTRLREALLDAESLVRAVGSGQRRGEPAPPWRRVELRYVDLKAGRHLQVTAYDDTKAHISNHALGPTAEQTVDGLLGDAFGNWHAETLTEVHQLRFTKKGRLLLHTGARTETAEPDRAHDQAKERLLPEDHPVLRELGISGRDGRIKPSRQAKYRQVEEFLRILSAAIDEARASGAVRTATPADPLRVADLGCGNAYLSFVAHAWLRERTPVRVIGVDVKEQSRRHNSEVAERLGIAEEVSFRRGDIGEVELEERPDVVLALHACDTATDEALHRGVQWQAGLILAAPCCHHDISAQLRRSPRAGTALLRDGILRERFADTLTDALRASLLRLHGYRVDVVEFVGSRHTPRNTLLRAVRTGQPSNGGEEYDALTREWQVRPRLAELLGG